jgi:acetone carboxylase gamma subunit
MEETKECPLCGEMMRIHERETAVVVPGTSETKKTKSREWVCPDCDNFEEIEYEPPPE